MTEKDGESLFVTGHQSQTIPQAGIEAVFLADGPQPPLDSRRPRPLVVAIDECSNKEALDIQRNQPIILNIQIRIGQMSAPHSQIKCAGFFFAPQKLQQIP